MKSIARLEYERNLAEEKLQNRKMLEMLLECYADKAEISIRHPDLSYRDYMDKDSEYIVQVYIPLKAYEINKLMEEI